MEYAGKRSVNPKWADDLIRVRWHVTRHWILSCFHNVKIFIDFIVSWYALDQSVCRKMYE